MELERFRRLGVLGGTFNPIHLGHLRGAEEALELLQLDLCLFVPAWIPPHKTDETVTSFKHRLRMLELAVEGHPRFRVSDLEKRLGGRSYTVKTLEAIRREVPAQARLFFLVGSDAFFEIHTWWHYREIFRLASVGVLRRPGHDEGRVEEYLRRHIDTACLWNDDRPHFQTSMCQPIHFLQTTHLDIASSDIRRRLRNGNSIRYLVPREVLDYIQRENVYGIPTEETRD
jgi:nicotinate-nucleotide adenylyltransferase